MRRQFDEELALLNRELITMGALCEEAIGRTKNSLMDQNRAQAEGVHALQNEILQKEKSIESLCLRLLLQQQPMAGDLRQISAALKMVTDMKRVGEVASDTADIIWYLHGFHRLPHLEELADKAVSMVHSSVDAFVKHDLELAQSVIAYDDIVDELFLKVKTDLVQTIRNQPDDAEDFVDLLMIAKYFEKIGDHAVNISEWVVYSLTGVHKGEAEP